VHHYQGDTYVRRHAKASFVGSTLGSGIRRGRLGLICLCVLGLAAFLGSGAPSAGAQACPNESFRQGPSANLPDCRAYEMVSPPDKGGQQVGGMGEASGFNGPLAAQDGGAAVFGSTTGAFGEPVLSSGFFQNYLGRRGASSWSSKGISPPLEAFPFITTWAFFQITPDLENGSIFGAWDPPLTPDAAPGTSNAYLTDNFTDSYRLISVGAPANEGEIGYITQAMSDDGSHVVFSAEEGLPGDCGPPAVGSPLCDWSAATGLPSLVGRAPVTNEVLTGGTVNIASPGTQGQAWRRPVSADGSRIFFEGGGEGCGVCVRINGATTEKVSETGNFQIASSDGTVAYVTDGGELKRYDAGGGEAISLTPTPAGEVQGVLGASSDGSRVYFVSKEALAPGGTGGLNNLYLWTQGVGFQFVATGNTNSSFTNNYSTTGDASTSRVTPDGMHLAFTANNSLTGYPDNNKSEAYLYSAATGELVCASCNPIAAEATSGGFIQGTSYEVATEARNLSNDGSRLFFNTSEALVPQDSNNELDVYEYNAASGEVALISTGTSPFPTSFGDASANGNDVFFVTIRQLVGIDEDDAADAYDARVNGGLASQHPPPPPPPCTGDECRGDSSSPDLAGPASAGFVGKGNVSQRQNCNKLGREAKKLSNRAKRLRKNSKTAKRNGKSRVAKQRNKKATRLAKRARNKSKSAKRCRKANRRASK